jgi:hypothetical protein
MYNTPKYDKPYEVKPDTGSLRKTEVKKRAESPDYFGSFKLNLDSVKIVNNEIEFKISGWKSVDKSGKSFLSLKLNNYTAQEGQEPQYKAPQQKEQDDDVPF